MVKVTEKTGGIITFYALRKFGPKGKEADGNAPQYNSRQFM